MKETLLIQPQLPSINVDESSTPRLFSIIDFIYAYIRVFFCFFSFFFVLLFHKIICVICIPVKVQINA